MMTAPVSWRKSSYSAQETDCVEVAGNLAAVRDSKNPEGTLTVDVPTFVNLVREGRLDH
jgi:hypothetical protein